MKTSRLSSKRSLTGTSIVASRRTLSEGSIKDTRALEIDTRAEAEIFPTLPTTAAMTKPRNYLAVPTDRDLLDRVEAEPEPEGTLVEADAEVESFLTKPELVDTTKATRGLEVTRDRERLVVRATATHADAESATLTQQHRRTPHR